MSVFRGWCPEAWWWPIDVHPLAPSCLLVLATGHVCTVAELPCPAKVVFLVVMTNSTSPNDEQNGRWKHLLTSTFQPKHKQAENKPRTYVLAKSYFYCLNCVLNVTFSLAQLTWTLCVTLPWVMIHGWIFVVLCKQRQIIYGVNSQYMSPLISLLVSFHFK